MDTRIFRRPLKSATLFLREAFLPNSIQQLAPKKKQRGGGGKPFGDCHAIVVQYSTADARQVPSCLGHRGCGFHPSIASNQAGTSRRPRGELRKSYQ